MNKLYSQIASLIVIVGLGTAWAFNVINETSFGTISLALLSAIYALYQKYEKDVVETKSLKLEDELKLSKDKTNSLVKDYNDLQKSILRSKLVIAESEVPLEVQVPAEKPKRKYYKSKKS